MNIHMPISFSIREYLKVPVTIFCLLLVSGGLTMPCHAATPAVTSLSPANAATAVDPLAQLSLTFDQSVSANTAWDATNGWMTIRRVSDNSVWDQIQACDTTRISVSGATVTITPHHYFQSGVAYYVEIGSQCFTNGSQYYAGISGSGTWSFTATPNVKVVKASGGVLVSMLLNSDGTVYAWGENGEGAVGDNTTTQRNTPVQVHGVGNTGYLTGIVDIAAGGNFYSSAAYSSCFAIKSDGTVYAWGDNSNDQLGDNTLTNRLTPVQVHGVNNTGYLSGIIALSSNMYACVLVHNQATFFGIIR